MPVKRKSGHRVQAKAPNRFHELVEKSADCIGMADAEGQLLYLNPAARRLLGIDEDDDLGERSIADCHWQNRAHGALEKAFAALKRAGSWTGEIRWQGRDGRQVPMIVDAVVHREAGGEVSYCSLIAHDVSKLEVEIRALNQSLESRVLERTAHLHAAHSRLQEEKERAQQFLDVAGVALIGMDLEGRISMINRRGCQLLEDLEANIIGKSWFEEFLSEDERLRWFRLFREVVSGRRGHLDDGEIQILTSRKRKRLIAWHSALLRDAAGRIVGILGSGEDITQRRRAEEARSSSESELRVITDSVPVLIAHLDSECRYVFNNAAYEGFFGVAGAELVGTHISELIGEQSYLGCLPHIEDALNGRSSVFEMQFSDREGVVRDATVHMVPDQASGKNGGGFYTVISDITERKRLERALRQSQKMEAVGLLASGISHDFNNLLMGIGGCCNVALKRLDEDSPVRIFLDEIRSAAASGVSISRQLLDLSRQTKSEVADTPLDALVADTESMLRRLAGADISLRLDLKAGHRRIRVAPGQFKQILLNLVVNARDAIPETGTVHIQTRSVELGLEQARLLELVPGTYLTLRVSDDGTGMDAATAERIFEPFFTTKTMGKGTGLGLYTVYGIVGQQGGHIEVDSEPGKGTSFTVYLPQSAEDTQPSIAISEVQGRRGNETVLVVEDDRLVQLAVREYLGAWGYKVIEASDGLQAVQVAREHRGPIPLLISDMVLPGMTGAKVAKAVREIHPEAKVIFMSAHSPAMLAEAGHLKHGTETLQKPFGEEELLERVRQVLGRPTPVAPRA